MEKLLQHLFDEAKKRGADGFEAMITLASGVLPGAICQGPVKGSWEIRTKMGNPKKDEALDVRVLFLGSAVKAITQQVETSAIYQPPPKTFNSLIK